MSGPTKTCEHTLPLSDFPRISSISFSTRKTHIQVGFLTSGSRWGEGNPRGSYDESEWKLARIDSAGKDRSLREHLNGESRPKGCLAWWSRNEFWKINKNPGLELLGCWFGIVGPCKAGISVVSHAGLHWYQVFKDWHHYCQPVSGLGDDPDEVLILMLEVYVPWLHHRNILTLIAFDM